MDGTTVVALIFSAGAFGLGGRALTTAGRAAAARRFARSVDLDLDPAVAPRVARRLAARDGAGALGMLAGVWLAVAVLAGAGPSVGAEDASAVVVLVVAMGGFLGQAAAAAGLAWLEASRPATTPGPRLARATAPRHGDYVHPLERRGGAWAAGASAVLAAAATVADRAGLLGEPAPWALVAACLVVPAAAVGLDELVARRLLDRGQHAATVLELAWDDALRARTLRDLATVPVVLGAWLPLALVATVGDGLTGGWPANPVVGVVAGLALVLLLVLVALACASLAVGPARHFRRTLWPAAAPHEVAA